MEFRILPVDSDVKKEKSGYIYLVEDNWNDWWRFRVLYQVYYKDEIEEVHYIGSVKIGEKDMEEDQDKVNLPDHFNAPLNRNFFSLGQDKYYYENLNRIGDQFRDDYLKYMNDIALDLDLYKVVKNLDVTSVALLRDLSEGKVKKTLNNLAKGNSSLSEYNFKFVFPTDLKEPKYELNFESEPDSNPPTNVHALIGRNGVGKTYLLNKMVASLMKSKDELKGEGEFSNLNVFHRSEKLFDNIIYLSFSAFDNAKYFSSKKIKRKGIGYSYIGLKQKVRRKGSTKTTVETKSTEELRSELIEGIWICKNIPSKRARLEQALDMLNSDPVFSMSGISDLLAIDKNEETIQRVADLEKRLLSENEKKLLKTHFYEKSLPICKKFSSGHSIVLLTITKLIQELEEKTLVLLDEPESHLHPPLLSTFTRILSKLLVSRNGIGIVATHSPVIIQEIPKKCVWIINRFGREMEFERPEIETFGENINILTKEVFSFEITHSGFNKLLKDVANRIDSYEEALGYFNNELGMEARVMLKALYNLRSKKNEEN
ncbi:AAA family ATPase [Rossellomorea marisflavi]|uniref:AAA family ATPase n=1 Tax=Rossellomorea marisflavi TaxID=189381 RepID=UPI0011E65DCE|nr:AAA family ATPase [Rossellomorea marisflavi]TYO68683.1 ATP-binding protein [Rossellomorea marisflavi]